MALDSNAVSLLFKVNADTAKGKAAFKDLETSVNRDMASMEKSASGFSKTLPALTTGFVALAAGIATAATAIWSITKASADFGSEIYDASQKTGLTAEAISSMKVAADQAGTSLDVVTGGAARFAKTIGQASDGSEEAQGILKKLGVTSGGLDTALGQAFTTIAKYPEGVQQMTAAQLAFGKSGADLLPFIKSFDGDLPALIAKVKELGLTIDDQAAAAADNFGDTLDTLNAQAVAVGRVFVGPLMKDITAAMTGISKEMSSNQKNVKEWGEGFASTIRGLAALSVKTYEFMKTPAGAALSMTIFGHWIGLNNALQALGGPPAPQGNPLPHDIPGQLFDPRFLTHLQPQPKAGPTSFDSEDTEAIKKKNEDAAKARDEARKRDLAALRESLRLRLKVESDSLEDIQKAWEDAFLNKAETEDRWRSISEHNLGLYTSAAKKILRDAFALDSQGKTDLELQNLQTGLNQALKAIDADVVRMRMDREKTITGAHAKEADNRVKISEDEAASQIAIARAKADTIIADWEEDRRLGVMTESKFAEKVGNLKLSLLQKERELETVETRRLLLDEEIAQQVLANSEAIRVAWGLVSFGM